MMSIVGWNTLLRGLRARVLSVLIVTSCAAGAFGPQALSAQSKPDVSEQTLTLNAGDGGQISLLGRSLTLFARAEIVSVDSGDPAEGIKASFARARGRSRVLNISTESTVTPGDYTINVVSRIRRRTYTLDFTLTVEGDVASVTTRPTTGLTRPTTATRPRPTTATRPSRPQATRPSRPQATRPSRPQATRPSRPQATRPTAARNAPPRVITVTPPDEIQADLPFDLSVEAGDDKGLADVTVAWRGGQATASFSGGTDETVSVSLPGFAAGGQIVSVIVRDNEGVRGTAWTGRLTVVAPPVDNPPVIGSFQVPAEAVANTDVEVMVAATDDNGLDRIEVHYSSDTDSGAQSITRRTLSGETSATETLVLENLSEGMQSLRLVVYDQAGARIEGEAQLVVTAPVVGETFAPVSVTSDLLVMTGQREKPFMAVSVTSDPLVMTGQREKPFVAVSVTSAPLVMTGQREKPFVAVSVTSDPLVMTGQREKPFVPVSVTSDPLIMTGQRVEEVVVIDNPPTIDAFEVPAEAVANTNVEVIVTASDDVGLNRIDVLYNSDNRPGAPSLARVSVSGQTSVTETILLENVTLGAQRIRVLVHDQAGGRVLGTEQMIVVEPDPPSQLEVLDVPAELPLGASSVIGITLDRTAPVGGVEVEITLSSGYLVADGSILYVGEGATYGELAVSVSENAEVGGIETVSAEFGLSRMRESVTILAAEVPADAPRLLELEVPLEIRSGTSSVIGVTLDRAAPAGGVEVEITLSSKVLVADATALFVLEGESYGELTFSAEFGLTEDLEEAVTASFGGHQLSEPVLVREPVSAPSEFQPVTVDVGSFLVVVRPLTNSLFEPVSVDVGSFQVVIQPIPEAKAPFEPVNINVGNFRVVIVPVGEGGN
jgi:hypothetical protein